MKPHATSKKCLGMIAMADPIAKAKQVLSDKKVGDIPALSLGAISDSEGVKYKQKAYPDKWDGMLVFNGAQRGILVNTRIDNPARHKFTFAHELGHYFLDHPPSFSKDGQLGIECNVSETSMEQKGREAEANRFAVELLMPQDRFLLLMLGAEIDFALIAGLAIEFMVSKQACSYRLVELTQKPCIVVFSKHGKITSYKASRAAKGFWGGYASLPNETVAHEMIINKKQQSNFAECDSRKWLLRTVPEQKIYECTRGSYADGSAMTILKW